MTVNPFWFGVLMTIVAEIVAVLLFGILLGSRRTADEKETRELEEALTSLEGKKVRIVRKNGYLIGETIDDKDEEE